MKIPPMVSEIFLADRRTDRQPDVTKLMFALRNFANVPNNN